MKTSAGHVCAATPCTIEIPRKTEFIATFELPGYEPKQVSVATRLAGAGAAGLAGNLILGGAIGMGVDCRDGFYLEHYPNPVVAAMEKQQTAPPPARKPRPKAFKPEQPTSWTTGGRARAAGRARPLDVRA